MPDPEFDALELGERSDPITVETGEQVRQASIALVSRSRRQVDIVSRHFDPVVYDTAEFADALRNFVLGSSRANVRVIVMDSTPILATGHRIVALAQRLSSYIEIRKPGKQHARYNCAFLLADRIGSVYRALPDRFDGVVSFGDRRIAGDLIDTFEELWAHSEPDPNLRRLSL